MVVWRRYKETEYTAMWRALPFPCQVILKVVVLLVQCVRPHVAA
jgi:hypothetical protein